MEDVSFCIKPIMMGTELNRFSLIKVLGSAERKGFSRSLSTLGPNMTMGKSPSVCNTFEINIYQFNEECMPLRFIYHSFPNDNFNNFFSIFSTQTIHHLS